MSADFVQRGRQLVEQDQYQEAVKVCRLGLLGHPTELEGRLVLGAALMALRRYDEVLAEMRVALELDAAHPQALALKAEALLRKGDSLQAVEILSQAAGAAPNDPVIQHLYGEAQRAVQVGGATAQGDPGLGEMTSHYPAHRGSALDEGPAPGGVTRPGARGQGPAPGQDAVPPPDVLAVGDRSSTISLDPDEDAELIEEEEDAPIASPVEEPTAIATPPRARPERSEPAIELNTQDLMPAEGAGAQDGGDPLLEEVRGFDSAYAGLKTDPTTAYAGRRPDKPRPAEMAVSGGPDPDAPTRAVAAEEEAPFPGGRADPSIPSLEFPADLPAEAPRAPQQGAAPGAAPEDAQLAASAARVTALFDGEEDEGVSSLEVINPATGEPEPFPRGGAPGAPPPGAPMPGGAAADAADAAAAAELGRSNTDDMRVIRAGLGMDGTSPGNRPYGGGAPGGPPPQGFPPPQGQPPPSQPPRASQPPPTGQLPPTSHEERMSKAKKKDRQDRKGGGGKRKKGGYAGPANTAPVKKQKKRRGLPLIVYALIALAVVGGAVFAGFKVRDARLERQIRAARADARERALLDTFAGYLEAQDAYERIVRAKDTPATRAARARIAAALAAEFGYQRAEAAELVEGLGELEHRDAAVARAFLALARGDTEQATELAARVTEAYPEAEIGPYLVGRAALLAGDPEAAARAFDEALEERQRPAVYIGLAMAEQELGRAPEARAALSRATDPKTGVSDHPAAAIVKARIMARSGGLPEEEGAPEASLEALIAESEKPIAEQEHGVSSEQAGWAALALAEVKLARGERGEAKEALEQAEALRPRRDPRFSEAYARALLRLGDSEAAKKEAEFAAENWPGRTEAHVTIAEVAVAEDNPHEALEALSKAGDLSDAPEALAVRGRAYLKANKLEDAVVDLDRALELAPELRSAIIARAEVDTRRGDARAALGRLEPLYDEDASSELVVVYTSALRLSGDEKRAREVLGQVLAGAPTPRAYIELGRLERGAANYKKAREAYQKAIELAPSALQARLEAAVLSLDTGDASGARESLDALVEDAPDSSKVLVEAARVHTVTGDPERALELLDQAKELSSAEAWKIARERGRTLIHSGEPVEAITVLDRAMSLKPKDGETRLLLLEAHARADNREGARKVLQGITKEFRGTPVLKLAQGREAYLNDRIPEALAAFVEARKLLGQAGAPPRELARADYWIGRCKLAESAYGPARKALRRALELDPSSAASHFELGNTYFDDGKYEQAVGHYSAAIELDPVGIPKAYFYEGIAYADLGVKKKARKALEKFLELAPDDIDAPGAKRALKRL